MSKADHLVTPVSVAGGYWTGSSTVVDLLSEHANCAIVPEEFTLFSFGQFFQELFKPMSDSEILGAESKENLNKFVHFNQSDLYPVRAIFRKLFRKISLYPKAFFVPRSGMGKTLGKDYVDKCMALRSLILEIDKTRQHGRLDEVKKLILEVCHEATMGAGNQAQQQVSHGIFDQIIAPPYYETAELAIPDMRYIFVDRNWRDQYISLRNRYQTMVARNAAIGMRPWDEDPNHIELDRIKYFLALRKKIETCKMEQVKQGYKNILWLEYENIVLDTDRSAGEIFEFLGLDSKQWNAGSNFFPEKSKLRIGKWKNPQHTNDEILAELEVVKSALERENLIPAT